MTTTGYNAPIEKNDKIRDDLNNIVKSIFEKEDNIKYWEMCQKRNQTI